MIEDAVRTILLADGTISGLIGTRMRPHAADPRDSLPYITYLRISTMPVDNFQGHSGTTRARIQVQCWDDDYSTVRTMAKACRDALDAYNGVVGSDTVIGVTVEDSVDDYVPPTKKPERGVYMTAVDFYVWFLE